MAARATRFKGRGRSGSGAAGAAIRPQRPGPVAALNGPAGAPSESQGHRSCFPPRRMGGLRDLSLGVTDIEPTNRS